MFLLDFLKKILSGGASAQDKSPTAKIDNSIYGAKEEIEEIHSIWDYIKMNEHTQAAHISSVLGFDEWISMEEILRRIREIFGMDYKNDRSLYPYIKTLVDVGLVETSSVGGKKKWRKRDVLIKLKAKKQIEEEEETEQAAAQAR
ncbi:MAG TPA: hypothetical protein VJH23_04580 [archaeon]|nr:hypothetical protein [archaeon]